MSLLVSTRHSTRCIRTREYVEIFDEADLALLAMVETTARYGLPTSEGVRSQIVPNGAIVVTFTVEEVTGECADATRPMTADANDPDDCSCEPGVTCKANSACPRNRVG